MAVQAPMPWSSRKRAVAGVSCERLATAVGGVPGPRQPMVLRSSIITPSVTEKRSAWSSLARKPTDSAGARTTPATGMPSRTSAMLTVNSLRPATNSFVPSRGSTRKNSPAEMSGTSPAATASSATTGIAGKCRFRAERISRSASSSASVTGEVSGLYCTAGPPLWMAMMARPAARAALSITSVNSARSICMASWLRRRATGKQLPVSADHSGGKSPARGSLRRSCVLPFVLHMRMWGD